MRVDELISDMQDTLFSSAPPVEERALCLRWLNRAYRKIYRAVFTSDTSFLTEKRYIPFFDNNNYAVLDNSNVQQTQEYLIGTKSLSVGAFRQMEDLPSGQYVEYKNMLYISTSDALSLPTYTYEDGTSYRYLVQTYIPRPKELVEQVTNDLLETDEPEFLEIHHDGLIYDALLLSSLGNNTKPNIAGILKAEADEYLKQLKMYYLHKFPYKGK